MHQPLEDIKMITCHLGNGSSIAAINDGRVLDTSMGLTPLDGFMMGTRCGSLDPSVVTFIMEKEGLTPAQMDEVLNKKSGLLEFPASPATTGISPRQKSKEMTVLFWPMKCSFIRLSSRSARMQRL